MSGGETWVPSLCTGKSNCLPSTSSCVTAAGRYVSAATSRGRWPALLSRRRQLGRHRRLAAALQAHQHDDVRRLARKIERGRLAQRGDQFLMDDFDDLLRGSQGSADFGADRALPHAAQKVLDDREVDVGFQQRQAHFAQRRVDVLLGQDAALGQLVKDCLKLVGQPFKHPLPSPYLGKWRL